MFEHISCESSTLLCRNRKRDSNFIVFASLLLFRAFFPLCLGFPPLPAGFPAGTFFARSFCHDDDDDDDDDEASTTRSFFRFSTRSNMLSLVTSAAVRFLAALCKSS